MSKCPFRPTRNNVIVVPVEEKKQVIVLDPKTKGRIANKFKVVAVGPGTIHDGIHQPMTVKVDDIVALRGGELGTSLGMFLVHKDQTMVLLSELDIVAVLEE